MTPNILLDVLQAETQEAIKDLILPTRIQSEDEEPSFRTADVYKMRLPDSRSYKKKAPYIIHQVLKVYNKQNPGDDSPKRFALVRSIFCVYDPDEQEGELSLLNLYERFFQFICKKVIIGKMFELDLEEGTEFVSYPEDTAPYYGGELQTVWELPPVDREVTIWQ